ncbi:DnaD domain protein [Anaerofustis stercorihominis DSM 17244]|uniref:DnaD domain protein n=1 Tax=Anaerofustis stercorihominis DSM 17244 TaxID=445971 RepID=B1C7J8_9FIRM|nr:DUF4373 domain-containing protein [Anaerofustis stercorihominis]EDS72985.1 DnaD domain protein [Anaerofustis stercorihominis DSM 17244]
MDNGIKYFPLDVHLDDEFDFIEADFGLKGFAIIVKLYQKIYGSGGYYCEWDSDVAKLFAKRVGLAGGSVVSEIIEQCLRRGIFSAELYEKYGILTSRGIQKRYFKIVKRRTSVEVDSRYLLIKVSPNYQDVSKKEKNVYKKGKNVCSSSQSKVKESKVKKSKHIYGEFRNVLLSDEEYEKLKKKYTDYEKRIEDLSYYIGSTGKSYKSHYLTILKWARDEKERERNNKSGKSGKETLQSDLEYESYSEDDIEKMMSEGE